MHALYAGYGENQRGKKKKQMKETALKDQGIKNFKEWKVKRIEKRKKYGKKQWQKRVIEEEIGD